MVGSQENLEVPRLLHCVSADGHDPLGQRPAVDHCVVNTDQCLHIIHDAACVCRKHSRIDGTLCQRVDQLAFCALGVLGLQRADLHAGFVLDGFLQLFDAVLLVVLHAEDSLGMLEHGQDDPHPADQLLGVLQHPSVVGCDVWLTLRAVGNDIFNFVRLLRRELHTGRKACASHTDDACIPDPGQDLITRHLRERLHRSGFCFLVLSVILNDDTVHIAARRIEMLLQRFHRPGHGRIHRRGYKAARICDLLAF